MDELGDPLEALIQGKVKTVEYSNGQVIVDAPRHGRVFMAGSFNPLHKGHRGMLAAALQTQREQKPGGRTHSAYVETLFAGALLSRGCVLGVAATCT